jgi:hypothetical protein
MPHSIV